MSNRLFQGIIHQTKEAIDRTIGVIDETLTCLLYTTPSPRDHG